MVAELIRDDCGQDLIEYVVLGSFIALTALSAATMLGQSINTWLSNVASFVAAHSLVGS
jgi:Flp pilus assembly pilin Flp